MAMKLINLSVIHLKHVQCRHMFAAVSKNSASLKCVLQVRPKNMSDNGVYYSTRTSDQGENILDSLENNEEDSATNISLKYSRSNQNYRHLPLSVKRMRNRMRKLHQLPEYQSYEKVCNTQNEDISVKEQMSTKDFLETSSFNEENHHLQGDLTEKYPFLRRKEHSSDYEKVVETSFGQVRMDDAVSNNRVGRSSRTNEAATVEEQRSTPKDNAFDEFYFGSNENFSSQTQEPSTLSHERNVNVEDRAHHDIMHINKPEQQIEKSNGKASGENFFDQEYFGSMSTDHSDLIHVNDKSVKFNNNNNSCDNIFEEFYFANSNDVNATSNTNVLDKTSSNQKSLETSSYNEKVLDGDDEGTLNEFDKQYFTQSEDSPRPSAPNKHDNEIINSFLDEKQDVHVENVTKQEKRQTTKVKANTQNPKTAYDMAMKIRFEKRRRNTEEKEVSKDGTPDPVPREAKWSGKKDSHGFRILSNQVLDIQNMASGVVVNILRDSIIYEDESLIAIDKPYGLPSHGGPGVHHSVGQLLVPLAKLINKTNPDPLQLVHRLDEETTGVMLIAKHHQSHHILRWMFKKRQVTKKYYVLTKGVPSPTQGIIDIPMAEGTVGDLHRMTLAPNYSQENRLMLKASEFSKMSGQVEAITNYRVLDQNNSAALVECQPETGVKHQIRCHMAFGLNTPILGDHKYSHYSKLAPQKLYPEILRRLGIRQSKVRHLAMHLHAKQIVLPEYKDGNNLFIAARLPKHFVQNMKWLQLKPDK